MTTQMNISSLLDSYNDKTGEQFNHLNLFVTRSLIIVIQNYFLKVAPSFVLTLCCRNSHTCNFYNDIMEKLFHMWGTPLLQIVVIPESFKEHIPGKRQYNLIFTDSFKAFLEIDVISYTADYNNNEFYHIFLQARDHLLPAQMQLILEYCWSHYIINCNIQIQNAQGEVLIYTYFPFAAEHCGQVKPVLINRFNGSTFVVDELFPKKLKNFHGCPLKAALWDVPPFLYLETDEHGFSRVTHGFEGHLLLELAAKLNFSIDVKIPPNDEQRGRFKGNTVNGALSMLMNRSADLSLGSFRQSVERSTVTTATINYYQTSQVVSFVETMFTLTSAEILLFPFKGDTWYLLLTIAGCICFILACINKYYGRFPLLFPRYNPAHTYLNILLTIIGMPATVMPQRLYSRIFNTSWLMFTLMLRTIYQALLFHLIRTHQTSRLPQSFEELVSDNYTAVMNRASYESLLEIPFLQEMRSLMLNTSVETAAVEFIEKLARKRYVAAGPLDFILHYGRTQKKAGVFKILPQPIVTFRLTMYLTKHSFLIDQFDEELTWFRGMGLINAWTNWELDYKYFNSHHLIKEKNFGLSELYMVFVIAGGGLCCAFVVFLLEILSKRCKHLRKLFLKS